MGVQVYPQVQLDPFIKISHFELKTKPIFLRFALVIQLFIIGFFEFIAISN